jgi:Domain of unknown function (DUF4160)
LYSSYFLVSFFAEQGIKMPKVADLARGATAHQYYRDHNPPHFHVEHAGQEVLIRIADLGVERGSIPSVVLQDAQTWAANHQAELALNWILAGAHLNIRSIPYP